MKIVLSCEHGGNNIPPKYQFLFDSAREILKTHRAFDLGALELFNTFKNDHISYSQHTTTYRLLVDINRSLYRKTLFSEMSKELPKHERQQVLEDYYYAFRNKFEAEIRKFWRQSITVLHVSVHSFTPVLDGNIRQSDINHTSMRIIEKIEVIKQYVHLSLHPEI